MLAFFVLGSTQRSHALRLEWDVDILHRVLNVCRGRGRIDLR